MQFGKIQLVFLCLVILCPSIGFATVLLKARYYHTTLLKAVGSVPLGVFNWKMYSSIHNISPYKSYNITTPTLHTQPRATKCSICRLWSQIVLKRNGPFSTFMVPFLSSHYFEYRSNLYVNCFAHYFFSSHTASRHSPHVTDKMGDSNWKIEVK